MLDALLEGLEELDRARVEQCFDTSSSEAAVAAGRIGRLVGVAARGKKFQSAARERFGEDALADPLPVSLPLERWRDGLARGSLQIFENSAKLVAQKDGTPVSLVRRLGRWYVFAPPLFDASASEQDARWDRVVAQFESYLEEASRLVESAADAASFRRDLDALGARVKKAVGVELQSLVQTVWSSGR